MNFINKHLLAAAAVVALSGAAQAEATYNFSGVLDTGPLAGMSFSGSFSFDDTLLNGSTEWLPLTALHLEFNTVNYVLAGTAAESVNSVSFDSGAVLGVDAMWGSISSGIFLSSGFGSPYLYDSNDNSGSLTLTAAAVPEPSTWLMGLAGLAFMGAVARRRKSA